MSDASVGVSEAEVEFVPIRAQGPGGQNVNKVSCAVHLRFDIAASSLPEAVKLRLLALGDQRISKEGVLVIKAQTSRSLEQNKADAMARLAALVATAANVPRALGGRHVQPGARSSADCKPRACARVLRRSGGGCRKAEAGIFTCGTSACSRHRKFCVKFATLCLRRSGLDL